MILVDDVLGQQHLVALAATSASFSDPVTSYWYIAVRCDHLRGDDASGASASMSSGEIEHRVSSASLDVFPVTVFSGTKTVFIPSF